MAAGVPRAGLRPHPAFADDYVWNAKYWAENAARAGFPEGPTPVVGAIGVFTQGNFGHVVYVEHVNSDGSFTASQRNANACSCSSQVTIGTFTPRAGLVFIYGGPAGNGPAPAFNPAAYNGHIVKQKGGNDTSWLVTDGHRNWIPNGGTYNCLIAQGHPGPDYLTADQLNQLPDQNGIWASCSSNPAPPTPTTTATPTTTPTPIPTTTPATPMTTPGAIALTAGPSVTPNGGGTGTTVTYTYSIKNTGGSPVAIKVAFFAVRAPDGSNIDTWCAGGTNLSLAAGASFNCTATGTYNTAGTYTWWADWEDTSGGFHALSGNNTFAITAPAPPPETVSVSKGAHVTTSFCTVSSCAYMVVSFANFPAGNHTVTCYGSYPPSGAFYSYTTSATTSAVCIFGYPGYQVWASVDGVYSGKLNW